MSENSDANPSGVTLRTLAKRAGLSAQAVSLALRNHPRVSVETRQRVQALAQAEGYVPDPQVSRLMEHLRRGRRVRATSNLCALTTRPRGVTEEFCDALLEGARRAATGLGFSLECIHLEGDRSKGRQLQRVLKARGVEGLLLLPMAKVCALDGLLPWEQFSVVAATLSVSTPGFHRVVADHFGNGFELVSRVLAAGFRRPGLVTFREHDHRCDHRVTAAFAWHGAYGEGAVPAYICNRLEPAGLRRWFATHKPDVVVAEHDDLAHALERERSSIPGVPLVSCSARSTESGVFRTPGVHDRPTEIGAVAIEVLSRLLATGQRGVPAHPTTTLIRGEWVGTLPRVPGRPGAAN